MKPYPSYEDSGVEWIGGIPSHWSSKKVKYLLNDYDGIKIGPFGSSLKLDTLTNCGIKIYGQENIIKDNFQLGHRYLSIERFEQDFTQYEIADNDVLVTMMGTTGKSKVFSGSYERGILDSHLLRLRFKESLFSGYLFSILLEQGDYIFQQIKLSSKGSIMEGLNSSIIKELKVLTPPPLEQQQIISFLDHKNKKIDELLVNTEKKIELLKEQRISLINHCVSKGLNPNVEMKDSGIEWIGEIPNHWEIRKVSTFGIFSKGRGISKDEIKSSGIPCIRYGEIYTTYNRIVLDTVSFIDEESCNRSEIVKKGSVLFTGSGETIDDIGKTVVYYGTDDAYVGGDIIILKLKNDLNPLFISYLMNSMYVNDQKSAMGRGEIVVHIYPKQLREIQTVLPPPMEQQQIVEYLDKHIRKIDSAIEKETQRIELLKEYRQSLIAEVVTGKIDVRDWNNDTQKLS